MKAELLYFLVFLLVLIFIFHFSMTKGEKKKITLINADGDEVQLDVEVAANFTTRAKGLMGRESLGEYEGMLFVFDKSAVYNFWMLNTTIALDAVFISDNGTIVDIIPMEPCGLNVTKCRLYTPSAESKYVLEVNQGFSEKHSLGIMNSRMLID